MPLVAAVRPPVDAVYVSTFHLAVIAQRLAKRLKRRRADFGSGQRRENADPRSATDLLRAYHIGPRCRDPEKQDDERAALDRKSTRLNSSHLVISYAVFCLKKKKK